MSERVGRWGRGLTSLALLVGLVVGVPAALLTLGGNPLPSHRDPAGLWRLLLQPDDGTVLARLLALVGWAAWAVFALSLLTELVNQVRRRSRQVVLPGLGSVQQWAAGLMLAVVALGGAAQASSALAAPTAVVARAVPEPDRSSPPPAAPPQRGPDVAAPTSTSVPTSVPTQTGTEPPSAAGPEVATPPTAAVALPGTAGRHETVHVVVAGDDLWSLAEHYYGQGRDWRRIAGANPGRLTGGPDRLQIGWRLVIPDAEAPSGPAHGGVRVRRGDTLAAIAERELGAAGRWTELYQANRDQLDDPDELPVGLVLRVPGDGAPDQASDRREASARRAAPTDRGTAQHRPNHREDPPTPFPAPPPGPVPSASPTTSTLPSAAPDEPSASARADHQESSDPGPSLLVPGLATVGGLLAASLLAGLAARRRWQLAQRPVGRRIVHPSPTTRPVEVELARRARPIGLRTLDRAGRALAATCAEAAVDVPGLRSASVSDEWLVLELSGPTPPAPRCFVDTGGAWSLPAEAADGLRTVPGLGEALRPWPLLVTLGVDDLGASRLVDLETRGVLAVDGEAPAVTAVLAAMAVELACSPWTDELRLTLVGDDRLAPALAQHNVTATRDVDALIDRLEHVAAQRRSHARGVTARTVRLDGDRAEAWTPEVLLVDDVLTADQAQRLLRIAAERSDLGISAVVRGPVEGAPATFRLAPDGPARLLPDEVRVVPQSLPHDGLDPLVELIATTGSDETGPAPWWSAVEPPGPPPDNVTYLGARRRGEQDEQERRATVQARMTEVADGTVRHPLLQLIGPVELLGAAGVPPARAARQCLEYCAWLLEHPGATAQSMAAGLLVAEGTRRSNMSRLRTWLGDGPDGEPYLPDAYSGRITLDPTVSSDWHQLRLLLAGGVDRAPSSILELALRLVRGAPFADAAPVQWHWAEELRTDIVSCVRDVGVELANRCLAEQDLDLARWSASRALVAAPGDELLVAARIRTEHLAGNAAETERLSLQLASQARAAGVDLDPATVDLIQEVMEGRLRARMA